MAQGVFALLIGRLRGEQRDSIRRMRGDVQDLDHTQVVSLDRKMEILEGRGSANNLQAKCPKCPKTKEEKVNPGGKIIEQPLCDFIYM